MVRANNKKVDVLLEDETLREGLQAHPGLFSLEEKLSIFNQLRRAGVRQIQAGSFVHPKIIPQMADTDELIKTIGEQEGVVVSALVLNQKGLDRAVDCGVAHVNMSVSVSDTHSRKNTRMPAETALTTMVKLIDRALGNGFQVRAELQCVFGCVYEGPIAEKAVLGAAEKMVQTGVEEISLADTTGMATPLSVKKMIRRFSQEFPNVNLSLHLHDTRGLGVANMWTGYEAGIRSFDVTTGGLGGCPFVKGAAGNVPTEDAVNLFESSGISTGIDLEALHKVIVFLETRLGYKLSGCMRRVLETSLR